MPYGLDVFEFKFSPGLQVVNAPTEHGGSGQFFANVIEATDSCAALVIRNPAV